MRHATYSFTFRIHAEVGISGSFALTSLLAWGHPSCLVKNSPEQRESTWSGHNADLKSQFSDDPTTVFYKAPLIQLGS